jgi:endonuclease/exonuclease/phosphatase (EEP) superfamily protein YafD
VVFLFWNVGRKYLAREVGALAAEHQADFVILAESDVSVETQIQELFSTTNLWYERHADNNHRLQIFTVPNRCMLENVADFGLSTIKRLVHPPGTDLMVVAVHLRSLNRTQPVDLEQLASREVNEWRPFLEPFRPCLMFGDFNLDPCATSLVSSEAFHAVADRRIVNKKYRIVDGKRRRFFYNPMWRFLGGFQNAPPGTFFYSSSNPVSYFWHAFDQVLVSPELLPFFPED